MAVKNAVTSSTKWCHCLDSCKGARTSSTSAGALSVKIQQLVQDKPWNSKNNSIPKTGTICVCCQTFTKKLVFDDWFGIDSAWKQTEWSVQPWPQILPLARHTLLLSVFTSAAKSLTSYCHSDCAECFPCFFIQPRLYCFSSHCNLITYLVILQ